VRIAPVALLAALVVLPGCKTDKAQDSTGPAESAEVNLEPRLSSRYSTPWGELGWKDRVHDTIEFTNEGQTAFLRCTVRNSPEIHCRWSKQDPLHPSGWQRGKAKLSYHPDHSLSGSWGHDDSDDDGGPCRLKPLPVP
jgi:hypothetical protein